MNPFGRFLPGRKRLAGMTALASLVLAAGLSAITAGGGMRRPAVP